VVRRDGFRTVGRTLLTLQDCRAGFRRMFRKEHSTLVS